MNKKSLKTGLLKLGVDLASHFGLKEGSPTGIKGGNPTGIKGGNLALKLKKINGKERKKVHKIFFSKTLKKSGAIDYGEYHLTGGDFLRQGGIGLLLCALVSYTFYKSIFIFLLLIPVGCVVFPLSRKDHLRKKRLWELTIEFREAVWIVSGYLSAGYSAENAFITTLPEIKDMYGNDAMIVKEFKQIVKGIKLNKPLEVLLNDFAKRSSVEEIRNFSEVFGIAKKSGGNMKEIIENTTNIIRDKTTVTEEIKNMTAAKRYEQSIMNLLPFGLIIFMDITTNGFLDIMYEGVLGRIVMTVCLIMIFAAYMLSQKILDIKV